MRGGCYARLVRLTRCITDCVVQLHRDGSEAAFERLIAIAAIIPTGGRPCASAGAQPMLTAKKLAMNGARIDFCMTGVTLLPSLSRHHQYCGAGKSQLFPFPVVRLVDQVEEALVSLYRQRSRGQ